MIPVEDDDVITTLTKKVIKFLFCSNKVISFHSNTSQINLQFYVHIYKSQSNYSKCFQAKPRRCYLDICGNVINNNSIVAYMNERSQLDRLAPIKMV